MSFVLPQPDWDITTISRKEKKSIKDRLMFSMTSNEEDYQAVIGYMHSKFPKLMDRNPDGMNLQWNYSPHKHKYSVLNKKTGLEQDMYAIIGYDPERDMEPVIFGGSYFKVRDVDDIDDIEEYTFEVPGQKKKMTVYGTGYVLFVDPAYRRMGLAQDAWYQEAMLYKDLGIRWQRDIQNEHSLAVTKSLFDNPDSCVITSQGRLKNDGTRSGIRILMDYTDPSIVNGYENLGENLKDFYNPMQWNFLDRENLSIDELREHWISK